MPLSQRCPYVTMTLLFRSRDSEIQLMTSFLPRCNVVLTLHCCCRNVIFGCFAVITIKTLKDIVATLPVPRHCNVFSTVVTTLSLRHTWRCCLGVMTSFWQKRNVVLTLHCCCSNVMLVLQYVWHCKTLKDVVPTLPQRHINAFTTILCYCGNIVMTHFLQKQNMILPWYHLHRFQFCHCPFFVLHFQRL